MDPQSESYDKRSGPHNADELIQMLMEVSGIDNAKTARELLADYNWQIDVAMNQHLAVSQAMSMSGGSSDSGAARPHHEDPDQTMRQRAVPQPVAEAGATAPEPRPAAQDTDAGAERTAGDGEDQAQTDDAEGSSWWRFFAKIVFAPLRYILGAPLSIIWSFVSNLVPGSVGAAEPLGSFSELLHSEYGNGPRFYAGSLNDALASAKRDLKFMLVYIHNPDHPDSARLCRDTLTSTEFVTFVDDNMVFWGETVRSRQGQQVAYSLKARGEPIFAMVSLIQGQMQVIFRHTGYVSSASLLGQLVVAMEQAQPALVAEQAERDQRDVDRTIRKEQNQAFEESLRIDREKAEQEAEAVRQAAAEEARKITEQQEAERAVLERQLALEAKKLALPAEPAQGEPNTRIRIRFPDGATMNRVFTPDTSVSALFDYVDVQEKVGQDFSLFTAHPKTDIANSGQTLEEAGLVPRAAIMVQDNTV